MVRWHTLRGWVQNFSSLGIPVKRRPTRLSLYIPCCYRFSASSCRRVFLIRVVTSPTWATVLLERPSNDRTMIRRG